MSEILRILKEGYWDRTSVVRAADGSLRVRKESKDADPPGPWARQALRNEIAYLASLPAAARPGFPPLLAFWEHPRPGYEIPFYPDRSDAARLLLAGELSQADADRLQQSLATLLFGAIHSAGGNPGSAPSFADHLLGMIRESLHALAAEERFAPLIHSPRIELNGRPLPGLQVSCDLLDDSPCLRTLRQRPIVRLHGDLILENILWEPLLLIDPVSVAGLDCGDPLFDLVKYESFATGELYAIREELVTAGPAPSGAGYLLTLPTSHPRLAPFSRIDLCALFRRAWIAAHGPVDDALYALHDAYFSLVMARNTAGTHQWARVLKACSSLARAVHAA